MFQNILIIDDSETSRMIIKKCLIISGMEKSMFYEAEDGIKALTFLGNQTVDLVVTDLNMPRMDGLTLIKKLKMSPRFQDLPVVVISSLGSDQLEKDLMALQVLGVIKKPLTPMKMQSVFSTKELNDDSF